MAPPELLLAGKQESTRSYTYGNFKNKIFYRSMLGRHVGGQPVSSDMVSTNSKTQNFKAA